MKASAQNIFANFVSKLWGFLSLYIFGRLYLTLAGTEQYGVISYYALIFGIASFVDVGISAGLTREFAKSDDKSYLKGLLRYFEKLYLPICICTALVICLFSHQISTRWLVSGDIGEEVLSHYIRLIGVGIGTQLMSSIYFGALMGRQKQVTANGLQIIMNVLKMLGGAVILYFYRTNLYLFFAWQIVCNLAYVIALRTSLSKHLYEQQHSSFKGISKDMWYYMGSMTLVSVLSAIGIQSDKLIASSYLVTSDFGFYSLASTLSMLPVLIVMPIAAAIFPVLVKIFSTGDQKKLYKIYEVTFFAVAVLVVPIYFVLAIYGDDIFKIWLSAKNVSEAPAQIKYLIIFLAAGNAFQALQYIPFYLLMAMGKTKFTIYQAAAEVLFLIPALYFFTSNWGLAGIGVPWCIIKFIGIFYLLITISRIQQNESKINYTRTVIFPTVCTLMLSVSIYFMVSYSLDGIVGTIVGSVSILLLSATANIFLYNKKLLNPNYLKKILR